MGTGLAISDKRKEGPEDHSPVVVMRQSGFVTVIKSRENVLYKEEGFTLAYSYRDTSSWSLDLFGPVTAWCLMVEALDRTMPHTSVVTKNRGMGREGRWIDVPYCPDFQWALLQAGLAHPHPHHGSLIQTRVSRSTSFSF